MQTLSASRRIVLISVNPRAGQRHRGELIQKLCEELAERNFACEMLTDIDDLASRTRELQAADQLRAVVAAGGDGTIALLANRTPPGTPLAILPLGTENLLARYFGFPADVTHLADVITDGSLLQLDMGEASSQPKAPGTPDKLGPGGRLFSLMAGCGFDAEVVRRLHTDRTGNIHHLSYVKPIVDAIRTYEYPELRVRYAPESSMGPNSNDELSEELTARWVFVVNVPRYAGGLNLAPGARGDDGLLDVCTFREGSLWNGLMYLGGVMLGQQESMQGFTHIRTRRLMIEPTDTTAAASVAYQLDGDPGGQLPVEIAVRPGRLTVLVTKEWLVRHEQQAARQKH